MSLPKEALKGWKGRFLSLFLALSNISPNLLLDHTLGLGCSRFITRFGYVGSENTSSFFPYQLHLNSFKKLCNFKGKPCMLFFVMQKDKVPEYKIGNAVTPRKCRNE